MSEEPNLNLHRNQTNRQDFTRAGTGEYWTLDQLRTLCRATEQHPGDTVVKTAHRDDSTAFYSIAKVRLEQVAIDTIDVGGGVLPAPIDPPTVTPPAKRRHDVVSLGAGQGFKCVTRGCNWTGMTEAEASGHLDEVRSVADAKGLGLEGQGFA